MSTTFTQFAEFLKGFCDGIMGVSYSDLANGTLYDIQESDGCLFFKKIRACALDGHHPSSRLYNLAEIIFSYRYNPWIEDLVVTDVRLDSASFSVEDFVDALFIDTPLGDERFVISYANGRYCLRGSICGRIGEADTLAGLHEMCMEGVEGYVSSVLDQCNPKETIEAFVQVQAGLSIECDMSFPEPRREEVAPLVRTHLERLFVEALEAFQENDDD